MAGEQKRFARFFFYLRNLREAALHTGARAEEAEDRGLELLHSAETEAELKKLEAGIYYDSYEKLGAHPVSENGVRGVHFAVWAP
ncbi:MAG: hypothetical protein KH702_03440, partial [Ruminococcus bicirculans]|nr:hypothetical protein [Ruminococcus bicirculans (ex Wegman et al. 2014)]